LAGFRAISSAVVARLDRATQYYETVVIEPRSLGVLDAPPSRSMTREDERAAGPNIPPLSFAFS